MTDEPALNEHAVAGVERRECAVVIQLAGELDIYNARSKLEHRQAFMLAAPGLETHRALAISGLDQHLAVHDTVDSALAAALQAT